MPTASFNLVPAEPFGAEELASFRRKLEGYPVYHERSDDLYVLFGTPEEQRETVALYSRKTTPTFDVECFVQLRPDKLLIHPGGDRGGMEHLREFVAWALDRGSHRLVRGGVEHSLESLLPPVSDLQL